MASRPDRNGKLRDHSGIAFPWKLSSTPAGRVVLPKPIRDTLGLLAGTKVGISPCGAGAQNRARRRTARLAEEDGALIADAETPASK